MLAAIIMANVAWADKTYTFDDGVALSTDWTVSSEVPTGGTGTCEISNNIGGSLVVKDGNYLGMAFLNKSGITITVTTTASYTNISQVSLDLAATDNSKPSFSAYIVDDNGTVVETLFEDLGSKDGFATGGTKKWGHKDVTVSNKSGHLQIKAYASSSGKYCAIDNIAITAGASGPVAVTGVTMNPTSVSIEAGQTSQLTATVSPTNADDSSVTWSSSNTAVATVDANGLVTAVSAGTATITVTTTDGSKTATCAVTVTAPAAPINVTAISLTDATVAIGDTKTLTVTYTPTDANTGKAVTWSSSNTSVATVDANGTVTGVAAGTATITATSTTDASITATCTITVQAVSVTGVSLDKSTASIQIGASASLTATVLPTNATNKNVTWLSSNTSVATVSATGKVTGIAAGTATITVTTEDGSKSATCTVTVTAGPPLPETSLTVHYPEVYEAKEIAGGYGGTLAVYNSREYEVYYVTRDAESNLTVATTPTEKIQGVCAASTNEDIAIAKDGWFKLTSNGSSSSTSGAAQDEYQTSIRCAKLLDDQNLEMHIQGFDQFSYYGKDNNATASKGRMFEVYIDGVKQSTTPSTTYSIRRFDITTGEHVIKIVGIGSSNNEMTGFSLRVAQEPRTKWLKGNDSTQVVMQTAAIKPVTYVTKYNNIEGAETKLVWSGATANGISLNKTTGTLTDTLVLSGVANCATGVYNYSVVAYYNGVETSRANGSFTVKSDIQATTDVNVDVYKNEEMDQIIFKYYALSADDVVLTWGSGGQPTGISGSGNNGQYIIGGTPTVTGSFPYSITVNGADTTIQGIITISELNYGDNAVLYLYKNNAAYEQDGVYKYLKSSAGGGYNLITRKAKADGMRPADQYANYKWVLISEDVDANNTEALALARGEGSLPVLSMKSFTYTPGRLNWGEPNNGSLTEAGRYVTVRRADHPIFKALNKQQGDSIQVLDSIVGKGLMPVAVNYGGTLCLATAYTRNIDDYDANGPAETFLHEVPASMHGGQKYLCLPIGLSSSSYLTTQGKQLVKECVNYLLNTSASTVELPTLAITYFSIGNYVGEIDDEQNLITIHVPQSDSAAMKSVTPDIQLASPLTHVTPKISNEDGTVDFSFWSYGVYYVVSDFINTRTYNVKVRLYDPEGIDEVYTSGEWINIFDIYGRKVATTNEDLHTMDLPSGMYIIVTESGQTLKIMR